MSVEFPVARARIPDATYVIGQLPSFCTDHKIFHGHACGRPSLPPEADQDLGTDPDMHQNRAIKSQSHITDVQRTRCAESPSDDLTFGPFRTWEVVCGVSFTQNRISGIMYLALGIVDLVKVRTIGCLRAV
jgi:hypothetical protein